MTPAEAKIPQGQWLTDVASLGCPHTAEMGESWLPSTVLEEGTRRLLSDLMRPAYGGHSTESMAPHPVGKRCPRPVQEPRWCRLLPTAWLSGFPSGLTSFGTPTSHCPPGVGGHWQSYPSVLKSHRLPEAPSPHTSEPGSWGGGGLRGEPLSCSRHSRPLGLFRPHFFSWSCRAGFTLPAITGLWV